MAEENKSNSNRYYGKYRALVTDNRDPKKQLRLKLVIPSILGEGESAWAMPCVPLLANYEGFFKLPQIGDGVWVEFEGGDLNFPVYLGGWSNPSKLPVDVYEDADKILHIHTRGGHKIQLDDKQTSTVLQCGMENFYGTKKISG